MGLKQDIINAKMKAENMRRKRIGAENLTEVPPELEKEAEGIRDAFINFLTHPDLDFTIAELKASLEIEEFKTMAPLNAKVDTAVNTTVLPGITLMAGTIPGATTSTGTGSGKGTGMVSEPIQMRKDGAKHGGRLIATGHAYVGLDDPTPNSDTRDDENEFTRVKLYYDKIPRKLL